MTTLSAAAIATLFTHGFSQTSHLRKHVVSFRSPKAENETLADIRACVRRRKRPQPQAFLRGARRNLLIGQSWRKRDYQVHAGLRAQNLHLRALHLGAELFAECVRECIAALRVQLPGFSDMPREMTGAYEIGQRSLIQV